MPGARAPSAATTSATRCPKGADLVSLVRIAHDLDDADLDALLAKVWAVLPPGGILLLAEPMAGTVGAERVGAYFAMYLMAMGSGRPRTFEDLSHRLYAAGLRSRAPGGDATPDADRPDRRAEKRRVRAIEL